jgi:hypothetical protein
MELRVPGFLLALGWYAEIGVSPERHEVLKRGESSFEFFLGSKNRGQGGTRKILRPKPS